MPWDQFNFNPSQATPNPLAGGGGTTTAGGVGNPIMQPPQPSQPAQPNQPMNSGWRPLDYGEDSDARRKAWEAAGRPDRDYLGNVVTGSTGGGNMFWNGQMYGGPGSRMGQDNGFAASMSSQGLAPAGGFAQPQTTPWGQRPQNYSQLPQTGSFVDRGTYRAPNAAGRSTYGQPTGNAMQQQIMQLLMQLGYGGR